MIQSMMRFLVIPVVAMFGAAAFSVTMASSSQNEVEYCYVKYGSKGQLKDIETKKGSSQEKVDKKIAKELAGGPPYKYVLPPCAADNPLIVASIGKGSKSSKASKASKGSKKKIYYCQVKKGSKGAAFKVKTKKGSEKGVNKKIAKDIEKAMKGSKERKYYLGKCEDIPSFS